MNVSEGSIKVKRISLIKKYISDELYIDILKVTKNAYLDNNSKSEVIKDMLLKNNVPFSSLGNGTNRFAVMIDGYALKISLDELGCIDNRREFLYSKALQPYVIKVYECTPSGLFAVTEYVNIFNEDDYRSYQDDMREILAEISSQYLIGDVGITLKNYINWGKRNDDSICILDFAYIYDVKYGTFTCTCDDSTILRYDSDYTFLVCPRCGSKYTFGDIRRRITRKAQEEEIGDIRRLSYNIHSESEEVEFEKSYEPQINKSKKKKKMSDVEVRLKQIRNKQKQHDEEIQDWENDEEPNSYAVIKNIKEEKERKERRDVKKAQESVGHNRRRTRRKPRRV